MGIKLHKMYDEIDVYTYHKKRPGFKEHVFIQSFYTQGQEGFFKKCLPCVCYHFLPLRPHPRILMHPPTPSHKHSHTCTQLVYIHTSTHMQACTQTHIDIHMNTHTHAHMYICLYSGAHIHSDYTHLHADTHAHTLPSPHTVFSKRLPSHC